MALNDADVKELMDAQHRQLARLYGRARARAAAMTRENLRKVRKDLDAIQPGSWGWAAKQATMAQLQSALTQLTRGQVDLLREGLADTARVSARGTATYLATLDAKYMGAVRPLRFDHADWIERNAEMMSQVRLRQYSRSFARYGASAVEAIEDEIARVVQVGESWVDARKKVWRAVRGQVEGKQWMVDRITRSESSAVYNGTRLEAMMVEDRPGDRMMKMLSATFDDKTAADSVVLHGQKRLVSRPFEDPTQGGKEYMAPPNRPNDREVVVPWRESWAAIDGEDPIDPPPRDQYERHDLEVPKNYKTPQAKMKAGYRAEAKRLQAEIDRAKARMPLLTPENQAAIVQRIEVMQAGIAAAKSEVDKIDAMQARLAAKRKEMRASTAKRRAALKAEKAAKAAPKPKPEPKKRAKKAPSYKSFSEVPVNTKVAASPRSAMAYIESVADLAPPKRMTSPKRLPVVQVWAAEIERLMRLEWAPPKLDMAYSRTRDKRMNAMAARRFRPTQPGRGFYQMQFNRSATENFWAVAGSDMREVRERRTPWSTAGHFTQKQLADLAAQYGFKDATEHTARGIGKLVNTVRHEMGHLVDFRLQEAAAHGTGSTQARAKAILAELDQALTAVNQRTFGSPSIKKGVKLSPTPETWGTVSQYACTNRQEQIAEVFALALADRYDRIPKELHAVLRKMTAIRPE